MIDRPCPGPYGHVTSKTTGLCAWCSDAGAPQPPPTSVAIPSVKVSRFSYKPPSWAPDITQGEPWLWPDGRPVIISRSCACGVRVDGANERDLVRAMAAHRVSDECGPCLPSRCFYGTCSGQTMDEPPCGGCCRCIGDCLDYDGGPQSEPRPDRSPSEDSMHPLLGLLLFAAALIGTAWAIVAWATKGNKCPFCGEKDHC